MMNVPARLTSGEACGLYGAMGHRWIQTPARNEARIRSLTLL
jgi:hypothetical protein